MPCNVSSNTPEEYFRRVIFIPFLDSLTNEFESRFSAMALAMIKDVNFIPANLPSPTSFHKKLGSGMVCGQGKRSYQKR